MWYLLAPRRPMTPLPFANRNRITSALLAACTLGLLLCPFVYLAMGALTAFEPALFAVTLPPLGASIYYLGRRYLREEAGKLKKTRHALLEFVSWFVVGGFLLIVSDLGLQTSSERVGLFFCIELPASAACLPFTLRRRMALTERLAHLPAWVAIAALALFAGAAAIAIATYIVLPTQFIGNHRAMRRSAVH
jgi:hypothetical protein